MARDAMGSMVFDTKTIAAKRANVEHSKQRFKLAQPMGQHDRSFDAKSIHEDIGWRTYVSPRAAHIDAEAAAQMFRDYVKRETNGTYHGEVRSFHAAESKDGDYPESGDMRDTWSLCVVRKNGELVDFFHFAPLADSDSEYEHIAELAEWVVDGTISYDDAVKDANRFAGETYRNMLESWLEGVPFSEMFPKAGSELRLTRTGPSMVAVGEHVRSARPVRAHTRKSPRRD